MPLREYRCEDCATEFEILVGVNQEAEEAACPQCGGKKILQLLSAFAPQVSSSSCEGPVCGPDMPCRESCPCLN